MRNDLLELMIEKLKSLSYDVFNMNHWMSAQTNEESFTLIETLGDGTRLCKPINCKTAGCAAGWATTVPQIRAAGLVLFLTGGTDRTAYVGRVSEKGRVIETEYQALSSVFELTEYQAYFIFHPSYYDGYRSNGIPIPVVIDRIRKVTAGYERRKD